MSKLLVVLVVAILAAVALCAESTETPAADNALLQFSDWLQEKGVRVGKLGVGDLSRNGRGVYAAEAIEEGDVLVAVPPEIAITSRMARAELEKVVASEDVTDMEYLALFVLKERTNPNSAWRPYLALLPSAVNLPYYWPESDLNLLKGSTAYDISVARQQRIAEFYQNVVVPAVKAHPDILPASVFTLDSVAWAVSVVLSRSYGLQTASGAPVTVLVPMLDLLNHGNVQTRFGITEEAGIFHIVARERVEKGHEVMANFGSKSNADLLSTYGFILQDNVHDGVTVRVALSAEDEYRSLRATMLADVGLASDVTQALTRADPLPAALLAALRLHYLAPADFNRYKHAAASPVSLECERAVLRRLAATARRALDAYPDSLEEDERLLALPAGERPSGNALIAVMVRHGEKAVLRAVLNAVDRAWLDLLHLPADTASQREE